MPDQVKKVYDPIKARWDILTPPQRYKLLGVIAVVLIAIIFTVWFAFRTRWETIVTQESSQTISTMRATLDNAGIRNRTRNHNSELQVDASRADEAILLTLIEGTAPNREHFTWANALDTGLATTDAERARLEILGMEGAAERQLMAMNGIHGADVIFTIPHTRPFERNAPEPRASVKITVGSEFSMGQGRVLANMVAANVSRLTIENIQIVNQFMQSVWDGAEVSETSTDVVQGIREQHTNQVDFMLRQILTALGFDDMAVAYNPVFDDRIMSEEIARRFYVPEGMDGTGIPTVSRHERAEMQGTGAGLEPGMQSNMAAFPNYAAIGNNIMSASQRSSFEEFVVNETTTATTYAHGVANPALSNLSVVGVKTIPVYQGIWEEDNPGYCWERHKLAHSHATLYNGDFEDFDVFHELIANAVGLPLSRVSLVVQRGFIFTDSETTDWNTLIPTILMVFVLLLLLAMLLFGLLRRQRAAGEDEESLEPQLAVEDLLVSTQLEEAREEAAAELEEIDYFKENEIKKHIEKFVNEKPEAVASLLRNWINVEEW